MHNFTASPPNKPGFFSPQTSATNFCELDYAITPYIAEFINTLTNLSYMYLAYTSLPTGTTKYNIFSWPATNLALFSVGIGSFVYHATLKHSGEVLDQSSMYAIITALNYGVYIHRSFASAFTRASMGLALALPLAVASYFNATSSSGASFDMHVALFVVSIVAFWLRTYQLIYKPQSDPVVQQQLRSPASNTGTTSRAYEEATRNRRLSLFYAGTFSFLLGFALWVVDGLCCEQLRAIRARIGLPYAWLFELHGVWHILTAVGAARFVQLVADLTSSSAV